MWGSCSKLAVHIGLNDRPLLLYLHEGYFGFFFLTPSDMLKSTQARAFVLGMSAVVRKPWVY